MATKWTEEQKKVISLRNRNILVSAAAGSGKTAVLVERILSKIMDKQNPVDIDRLLIMTFTRAAAGEMKERITAALEKAIGEDPENEHLQKQTNLIHTAQITTIDGFCAYIIRNYFHLIGLDPGYRTGDEGELKLLKKDVLKELLEEGYASGEERYRSFVECYASGKTDEGLEELILKLYESAMSNPYPQKWLEECLKNYKISSEKELEETQWMKLLWETVKEELDGAGELIEAAKRICHETDGPYLYEDALDSDLLMVQTLLQLAEKKDYDEMSSCLGKPSFARLSAKKMEADPRKKENVKELREEAKDIIKGLGARFFHNTQKELLEYVKLAREPMETLVELTLAFKERYGAAKRDKNILDFTDMEHFALEILMTGDGEDQRMSQAARELSERYEEVLVDEYQDSNLVQEMLTNCVSGWINGRKNIFMVGDVKQSIYRFRLARPELFMEKYKTYSTEDSSEQRIDLHKNFRSRKEVLEAVNYIFRQLMGEDLGGITYDEAAALYPGAVFPEGEDRNFLKTEVLLVEKDGEELEEEQGEQSAVELEALAVAQKIKAMVGKERILDKETGKYRPVEYGDIVILLRTAYGWADTFREVLSVQGIPAYCASRTGYFSATEVVTVLNYLKVCDNPLQDIPLAGVLRSPMVGCTSQELAEMKERNPEGLLYESVCSWKEEDGLGQKLRSFLELLERVRNMAAYTPVHQLILYILKETGYGNYARAMPGGEQRYANLSMLVEKAMDYEKTSYRGLFNFVRYIEQLQKYEVDYGEVSLLGAGSKTVEIMTIHKSKGLEFPVVFVAGMEKQFNFQDMNASLLIHPELGLGADAILPGKRIVASSLNKQLIRRQLVKESLGEELRVLYVALTRAKEKLILTGTVSRMEKLMHKLERYREVQEELLSMETRMRAKNYWDFVLPALARHRSFDPLLEEFGIYVKGKNKLYNDPSEFEITKVTAAQMVQEEILHQAGEQMERQELEQWDADQVYDGEIRKEIQERFSFSYPYGYLKEIPVKVSVSELKKRNWHGEYDREETIIQEGDVQDPDKNETDMVPVIPRFMQKTQEEFTGAARGTAYHRIMECMDYSRPVSEENIRLFIEELQEQKKLSREEAQCIRVKDIECFLKSELGHRMAKASAGKMLRREQPFVISRKAWEIEEKWESEETVLVQGIIDAYFYEEDGIVLVDYKTDKAGEKRLAELYRGQLLDYAQALEGMIGEQVKEKYIYSFTLKKAILL